MILGVNGGYSGQGFIETLALIVDIVLDSLAEEIVCDHLGVLLANGLSGRA